MLKFIKKPKIIHNIFPKQIKSFQDSDKSLHKHMPAHLPIKFFIICIRYQPGGETFSFFCDSGELLEILNFLPASRIWGSLYSYSKTQKPQKVPASATA